MHSKGELCLSTGTVVTSTMSTCISPKGESFKCAVACFTVLHLNFPEGQKIQICVLFIHKFNVLSHSLTPWIPVLQWEKNRQGPKENHDHLQVAVNTSRKEAGMSLTLTHRDCIGNRSHVLN